MDGLICSKVHIIKQLLANSMPNILIFKQFNEFFCAISISEIIISGHTLSRHSNFNCIFDVFRIITYIHDAFREITCILTIPHIN
ncbi:hypothetical protein AO718_21155 [Aeromonas veronii]|nr:hypothetical protein AO718_21155 [Aeromonas veronii]